MNNIRTTGAGVPTESRIQSQPKKAPASENRVGTAKHQPAQAVPARDVDGLGSGRRSFASISGEPVLPPDSSAAKLEQEAYVRLAQQSDIVTGEIAVDSAKETQAPAGLDEMYAHAAAVRPQLGEVLNSVAAEVGGQPILAPLKSRGRAIAKIEADYGGDASKIKDLARGTIVVQTEEQARRAVELILQSQEVSQIKDRFANPKPNGYMDANINLVFYDGDKPVIVEARVELESIRSRALEEHKIYEQIQAITRRAEAEHRPLTPAEAAQVEELERQSQSIYKDATKPAEATAGAPRPDGTHPALES